MIVEYVRYALEPDAGQAFEEAYGRAGKALAASEHCLGFELSRCVDEPTQYILRIEWDSAEGHLQGFRSSAEFRAFLAEIRRYVPDVVEMRHYELTAVVGGRGR